jgi:hypothetical protein
MLLISSSSLDDGGFEGMVELIEVPTELPILFEVPLEVLDVVEHVDFFLVNDVLILPPTACPPAVCSDIEEGELGVAIICPLLLIMLQVVPDRLIGVNSVAGVDSAVNGKAVVWTVLLLFSIFMLKHWVGAKICCGGEWIPVVEIVDGSCIAT